MDELCKKDDEDLWTLRIIFVRRMSNWPLMRDAHQFCNENNELSFDYYLKISAAHHLICYVGSKPVQ